MEYEFSSSSSSRHHHCSPCPRHRHCRGLLRLLKQCIDKKSLEQVKQIEAHIRTGPNHGSDILSNSVVGSYLVVALAKCGSVEDAAHVSSFLPPSARSVFSWTAIISAYVDLGSPHGALAAYRSMHNDGILPDSYTFVALFRACGHIGDLALAKRLHCDARNRGIESVVFVANTILSMYGKCGDVSKAEHVFSNLCSPTTVSWNAILSTLVENGSGKKALLLYRQMMGEKNTTDLVNEVTMMIGVQACGTMVVEEEEKEQSNLAIGNINMKQMYLDIGRAFRADALRKDYTSDILVATTLVSMYGKCGALVEAENVFISIVCRNAVSWTSMLSAYIENGEGAKALVLYRQMHKEGFTPNEVTFMVAIQACGLLLAEENTYGGELLMKLRICLEIGQALHVDVCRMGYGSNESINSTLVSVYGKCGAMTEAEVLFLSLSRHNVVLCTSMLSTYVEQGEGIKALEVYGQMMQHCYGPVDVVTLKCVLQACSETGSYELCKQIHFKIVSSGHEQLFTVQACLIHAYGGCANMRDAQEIFDECIDPNIVSWNACIGGYAHGGENHSQVRSFRTFEEMMFHARVEPDEVTFAALLLSCAYIGNILQGLNCLEVMVKVHGLKPDIKHYGSIVDLLGRAGDFKRVEDMLNVKRTIHVKADLNVWLSLLGACRIHGNLEFGKEVFSRAVRLEPGEEAAYVLMSNIYADIESAA